MFVSESKYNTVKQELDELKVDNKRLKDRILKLESDATMATEKFELKEKKAVAALEDKLGKLSIQKEREYEKKLADFKEKELAKQTERLQKALEDNYKKLQSSLTKLHEEGNANTKFVQEMSKEIIRTVGLSAGGRPQDHAALNYNPDAPVATTAKKKN